MKLKRYLYLFTLIFLCSCVDMDIPPMSNIGDKEIFGTESGITSYMARVYSEIPMEDFRYHPGELFNQTVGGYRQLSCMSGEGLSRLAVNAFPEKEGFWNEPYLLIREVNYFLETMPTYASSHREEDVNHYLGEVKFIRAFAYFALAKRYGGVPLVDKVIDYPGSVSLADTKLIRASEEEIWDFISEDLDFAIQNMKSTSVTGRANKYVAAALKSRVMLFAGSIAKYNEVEASFADKRYCGIPVTRAKDYFKQAFEASLIVDQGGYELYKAEWTVGDKVSQAKNFTNLFLKENKEWIFAKYYSYPTSIHSYDCVATPTQFMASGGTNSGLCPSLEFVEMFDGFEKNDNGKFQNYSYDGTYKYFESTHDAFKDAEPRLLGTVLFPGEKFKDKVIDVRRGIYTGGIANGISSLTNPGDRGSYENDDRYSEPLDPNNVLKMVGDEQTNSDPDYFVELYNGTKVKRAGVDGYVHNAQFGCCVSGFYLKKYLNPTQINTGWSQSSQAWIELRYAEVLLNMAEASAELLAEGETTSPSGKSYKTEGFKAINAVRERGGAKLLLSETDLDIDVVRLERRKELAFENKAYWDLRRWRILDDEQYDKTYRILQPFLVAGNNKVILDARYMEQDFRYTYDVKNYYQRIPGYEIAVNPNCKQNPGQL